MPHPIWVSLWRLFLMVPCIACYDPGAVLVLYRVGRIAPLDLAIPGVGSLAFPYRELTGGFDPCAARRF